MSDTVTLSQTKQELANEEDHFQWFSNRSIEMFDKGLVKTSDATASTRKHTQAPTKEC